MRGGPRDPMSQMDSAGVSPFATPTLSLPKGGGAIRGIGEKFAANPVTGTASLAVPIFTSPGRVGFTPQLVLSYDSGSGNSPFGQGWHLSLSAVTRRTDQGLPRYLDAEESDVYMLAGAEDLVPALVEGMAGWVRDAFDSSLDGRSYRVQRYRPRVEGLFARVERWHDQNTGDVFWKTITKENLTSFYGRGSSARIADPADPLRVFTWLLEETADDKGNLLVYEYKAENEDLVEPSDAAEKNRLAAHTAGANRYVKRILYGNQIPFEKGGWHFQVVFDYGEHDPNKPAPDDVNPWPVRPDPYSTCRPGFELRAYRLCRRVLMFHNFPELGAEPCLIRSTDFQFNQKPEATTLIGVIQRGYIRDQVTGAYQAESVPALEFTYTEAVINEELQTLEEDSLANAPLGLDNVLYQWVDLDGEGVAGLLTRQATAWFYKRNLGQVRFRDDEAIALAMTAPPPPTPAVVGSGRLASMQVLGEQPSLVDGIDGGQRQIMDLAGDGRKALVDFSPPLSGYQERTPDGRWEPFQPFAATPNIPWADPHTRLIDLTGDGLADVLIADDELLTWYASLARDGFAAPEWVRPSPGEERSPQFLYDDPASLVSLADMDADGMTDVVRIRNGEVCYWQNLGYGRFGPRIVMRGSPVFDSPDKFNPRRLRLADIDGTGTTDIIYLGDKQVTVWLNQAGNSWSAPRVLSQFPAVDDLSSVTVADLLGTGTACLIWSSPLPGAAPRSMSYIDLMSGQKPRLLQQIKNNLGAETRVQYAPSTRFYLQDRAAGRPWLTKVPFPVQVVERVETLDVITGNRLVTAYRYHHGYYDAAEREFRGFGMVEQWDAEEYATWLGEGTVSEPGMTPDRELYQPPVYTKTWFHTGACFDRTTLLDAYAAEYYRGDPQGPHLPATVLPTPGGQLLNLQEEQEAWRALKGSLLRQEIYGLDEAPRNQHPYKASEYRYGVQLVQPLGGNAHAVFSPFEQESLDIAYERDPQDPRVGHKLSLALDAYGNVLQSAGVAYPRRAPVEGPDTRLPEQKQVLVQIAESRISNQDAASSPYRLGNPVESQSYELTGLPLPANGLYTISDLAQAYAVAAEIPFETTPAPGVLQRRVLALTRTLYFKDDRTGPLPLGDPGSMALPCESYKLAFTPGLLTDIFGTRVSETMLRDECRYIASQDYKSLGLFPMSDADGTWWVPTGQPRYATNANLHFYVASGFRNPFGHTATVTYDSYDLLVHGTTDALGNVVAAVNDYRVLQPAQITDANGNRSAARFDRLGMVVATAVLGKEGAGEGDTLDDPTTRTEYDLFQWQNHGRPNFVNTFARLVHGAANPGWQQFYSYSDGFGRELMTKFQAAPGPAPARDNTGALKRDGAGHVVLENTESRWVGSGRTVFNNKGRPVKQYEPFYSSTPAYEDEADLVGWGVTPVLHYDPPGRLIRTDYPNGSFSLAEMSAWEQKNWDVNDTVLASQWHAVRQGLPSTDPERFADTATLPHANTPGTTQLDVLGRTVLNRLDNGAAGTQTTLFQLDLLGNLTRLTDDRGNPATRQRFDLASRKLFTHVIDSGERRQLPDAGGQAVYSWDSRDHRLRREYDPLRRAARLFVQTGGGAEILAEDTIFGESQPSPDTRNLRLQIYQHRDGAGILTSNRFDFKGNLLSSTLQLLQNYKDPVDWQGAPALESETFTTSSTYDALNRAVTLTTPDGSITSPGHDESNKLNRVTVSLRGSAGDVDYVRRIGYTAKGQREFIEYANGARTDYTYDPLTYKLTRLLTVAGANRLQDLSYTYDPVGNVVEIRDDAQQTIFFNNAVVNPVMRYGYDPIYRLVEANGREHPGQVANPQHGPDDSPRTSQPHPSDGSVMQAYRQRYAYDTAGNLLQVAHLASSGNWTRRYDYAANSNRLRSSSLPGDPVSGPFSATYDYDAHGNMIRMPHLAQMDWDFRDQLHRADLGGGGEVFHVYNVNGMRVRKIVERLGGLRQERIYLGGYEIYRQYQGEALQVERQSLGVMDNERRIAIIETKTIEGGAPVLAPAPLTRYQLNNRQCSASLELDDAARVISYEEYYPFGNTSYQGTNGSIDLSRKRYRYLGRERDADTGLAYYLARYYAPWLGRWTSCDPAALQDGVNTYAYARNNPINYSDPTGTQSDEEKPGQVLDILKKIGISTDRGSEESGGGLFGAIGEFFSGLWSGIKTVAGAIAGAIATAASAVWNWTKGAVATAWNWIKNAAAAAWEWTKNAVSAAWNWIKNAAAAAWDWIKNAASAVWNWTKNAAITAWEWTKNAASAVWNWTKRAASAAWEWIKNAAATVWDWTKRAAAVIWSGFKTVVGFTWNWILAPLIRMGTNAALGFLIGGIPGAIAGAFLGAFHGWAMAYAHSYDWTSPRGWAQFLADNTWSLPNSAVGSLFATINIIGGNEIVTGTSKGTGQLYFKGQWFPPYDTTFGNVTVGTVVPDHEREHAFQARLFGPLFYPLVIANYAVATVLPYWVLYHDFAAHPIKSVGDYFKCGVYPHTWHEEWAYSVQGGTC